MKLRSFRCRQQKGMTLLEVVVSMLIIGLGLAMTLSMIQASNRYGSSAEYRSVAMNEIQSIMDSMRANILGADGYIFGTTTYEPDQSKYSTNVVVKSAKVCDTAANCTDKEKLESQAQNIAYPRAKADMEGWLNHVQTSLPGGQAAIEKIAKNTYKVTVMWNYGAEESSKMVRVQDHDSIDIIFPL